MLNLYWVNDNQEVNVEKTQIMCCIFCYNGLVKVSNSRTKARKWLILYCKTDEIPTSKKTCWYGPCHCCKKVLRWSKNLWKRKKKGTNQKNTKCV